MTQKTCVEKYMLQYDINCLTAENIRLKEELALAEDGIRIALKTAGHENVNSMNQFERASALLNMAQELAALTDKRHATMRFEEASAMKTLGDNMMG